MDYPIVDWNSCIKLAGNNEENAKEMLHLLINSLPTDLEQIKEAFLTNQQDKLARYMHRLHGALCFCGVPRLKYATVQLEAALKQQKASEVNSLFIDFEREAKQLIEAYSKTIE